MLKFFDLYDLSGKKYYCERVILFCLKCYLYGMCLRNKICVV